MFCIIHAAGSQWLNACRFGILFISVGGAAAPGLRESQPATATTGRSGRIFTIDLPLADVRVVDLSRVLAGPYCTMMLGDLGADVVKVELPGVGDDTRGWGPPFAAGESAYYLAVNRNKRGITLNLKQPRGRIILEKLIADADVVVENFRAGTLERLGLGYDQLAARNPRLVSCTISAFGTDGPYRDLPGYDFTIEAMSGLMSITGDPEGEPVKVGVAVADLTTGMFAANAVLAALRVRDRTGFGQRVEVSLLESVLGWLANVAANYLISGKRPQRYGNAHPNIVPYQTFRVRDGHVVVAVGNDQQFQRLCLAIERPDLAAADRYRTNAGRVQHREALIAALQETFLTRNAAEWFAVLREAEVPCGPILAVDQAFGDPQVVARGVVRHVDHPTIPDLRLVGPPYRFSRTPPTIRRHPPLLGEHTAEVLGERLGLTEAEVAQLRAEGVV
ncbi:MAG: CoA transferase [Chloroflexi bacterium]|nr:CoA transferase [Chloroflexota bacterium]